MPRLLILQSNAPIYAAAQQRYYLFSLPVTSVYRDGAPHRHPFIPSKALRTDVGHERAFQTKAIILKAN